MAYKIAFLGTPLFAVPSLQSLIQDKDFEVVKVFTQPDRPSGRGKKLKPSPVKLAATEHSIEVLTPEKVSTKEFVEMIQQEELDLGIVVAYGQLLSQKFLDSFKFGCVNVHSSLLPRWRGAAPMQRAIMAGDQQTGVSLQKVVKKLDAGDVIAERKIELPLSMGATELYQTLSKLGSGLLTDELKKYLSGDLEPRPQNEDQVTHAAKISKDEGLIDWKLSALEVHNKVRGLDMGGPFAFTKYNNKTLKIHSTQPVDTNHSQPPGTVLDVQKDSFVVACGHNQVEVLSVQPENKARMSAADFIRGYHIKKGECFDQ